MNPNYQMILKSFVEGCALSGIFTMSLPLNSVTHFHLHPSLHGNHPKIILLLKYLSVKSNNEIFAMPDSRLGNYEWQAMQSLVDDRNIIIKKLIKVLV